MAEKKTTRKSTKAATTTNGKDATMDETRAIPDIKTIEVQAITNGGFPDIGLKGDAQAGIVGLLMRTLADEYVLYTKLRNYHWNVTGPQFFPLHAEFEKEYEAVAEYVDEIAERIRSHGVFAPGSMRAFLEQARLKEDTGTPPDAATMIANLVADHEALVRSMRADIEMIDDEWDDVAAEDLLTGLMQNHQKHAWMLRSNLGK